MLYSLKLHLYSNGKRLQSAFTGSYKVSNSVIYQHVTKYKSIIRLIRGMFFHEEQVIFVSIRSLHAQVDGLLCVVVNLILNQNNHKQIGNHHLVILMNGHTQIQNLKIVNLILHIHR